MADCLQRWGFNTADHLEAGALQYDRPEGDFFWTFVHRATCDGRNFENRLGSGARSLFGRVGEYKKLLASLPGWGYA